MVMVFNQAYNMTCTYWNA